MRHLSNAFFHQAEVTQVDRWEHGPLELVFFPEPENKRLELVAHVQDWNSSQRAGFLRSSETMDGLRAHVPGLEERRNPNMILVPTYGETSELDVMLASLLPDALLEHYELERRRPSLGLLMLGGLKSTYGTEARSAFTQHIWSYLAPRARLHEGAFSPNSSLRLLAGDTRFWAHRLYRLALDRRDEYFEPTTHEDEGWKPIDQLRQAILAKIPEEDRHLFKVERPLMGGTIWDVFDANEREDALQAAVDGDGVMESLEPVIELLHQSRAHEDFSDRHSWIKEDFERSFYSKRSRLKVHLVETVDDAPIAASAWSRDSFHGVYTTSMSTDSRGRSRTKRLIAVPPFIAKISFENTSGAMASIRRTVSA